MSLPPASSAAASSKPSRYTFRRYAWTWFPDPDVTSTLFDFEAQYDRPEKGAKVLYTPEVLSLSSRMKLSDPKHRFSIYQIEICPTTQRLHYQGYSEFTQPVTITAIKKLFDMPGCHYEPANSDQKSNIKYCTKLDTRWAGYWHHGEPGVHQGSRTDLHALYELAMQEASAKGALKTLGPIAMRNLPLYIRTVSVIQGDDAAANRIDLKRRERRLELARKRGLPTPPNTSDSDDNMTE